MKNINNFMKKNYNQEVSLDFREKKEIKESQMITHEVDLEYVMKTVEESLKTDEAYFQENSERLQNVT